MLIDTIERDPAKLRAYYGDIEHLIARCMDKLYLLAVKGGCRKNRATLADIEYSMLRGKGQGSSVWKRRRQDWHYGPATHATIVNRYRTRRVVAFTLLSLSNWSTLWAMVERISNFWS